MLIELGSTTVCYRWPNHLFFALFGNLKGEKTLSSIMAIFEQFNPQKLTRKAPFRFFWTLSKGC